MGGRYMGFQSTDKLVWECQLPTSPEVTGMDSQTQV